MVVLWNQQEAVKVIALGNGVTASEIINRILNNNREIKMIKSAIKIEAESESGVFAVPGPKSKLRKDK
ncbi:hypothetical protein Mia14_0400 [Candidatus Mancarchaeum acidiphilum]|uniref:Uncharacterized protein n=1 Tax=Candidatus Mancarchaeum acidiphilum TaxID=1920749 RepID=A0A218NMN5_9ARCH|nr:hypothetical protein [Candidatus Mancarchaeum acidiphilum]ASI13722.1 hypothetical protein Mia14_0400 [Candidatus Mancarchaeum acidiphilum]